VPQEQARERAAGPAARAPAGLLHPLRVLQRRLGNAYVARALTEGGPLEPEIAGAIESERGRGRPLDPARRESFEHAFGAQFGDVRLHDDETAADLTASVGARAFTVGSDIFFGEGQYDPVTGSGRELLAHELTHVVQQGGGAAAPQAQLLLGPSGDAYEQEADQVAREVVQRQDADEPAGEEPEEEPEEEPL
jgi:hypothetical protein